MFQKVVGSGEFRREEGKNSEEIERAGDFGQAVGGLGRLATEEKFLGEIRQKEFTSRGRVVVGPVRASPSRCASGQPAVTCHAPERGTTSRVRLLQPARPARRSAARPAASAPAGGLNSSPQRRSAARGTPGLLRLLQLAVPCHAGADISPERRGTARGTPVRRRLLQLQRRGPRRPPDPVGEGEGFVPPAPVDGGGNSPCLPLR